MNTTAHNVTFDGSDEEGPDVYQDGILVASISREPECWVNAMTKAPEGFYREAGFMARFKCARPMANAKRWCRFILERMTVAEYLALREGGKAPLTVATDLGYDPDPWKEEDETLPANEGPIALLTIIKLVTASGKA